MKFYLFYARAPKPGDVAERDYADIPAHSFVRLVQPSPIQAACVEIEASDYEAAMDVAGTSAHDYVGWNFLNVVAADDLARRA